MAMTSAPNSLGKWRSVVWVWSWPSPLHIQKDGGNMVTPIPIPGGRWELGHDLCPAVLGKWRSVVWAWSWSSPSHIQKEGRKMSVAMVTPIPIPEGRWELGHGLCPCHPSSHIWKEGGKMSVAMVAPIPIPEGRSELGHGLGPQPMFPLFVHPKPFSKGFG